MIIPLEPRLEGLAERRFFSFARQMLDRQARDPERIGSLVKDETTRVSGLDDLKGQSREYTACVRVLGDLAQLRWTLVESGYGLELHSPRPQDKRISGPVQALRRKEAIRAELRPRVLQQFADPNVRKFIQRVERPPGVLRAEVDPRPDRRRCRAAGPAVRRAPISRRPSGANRGAATCRPALPPARRRRSGRLHQHPAARHLALLPVHVVDTADADTGAQPPLPGSRRRPRSARRHRHRRPEQLRGPTGAA